MPRKAAAGAHGHLIFGVVLVVVVGLWALLVLSCLSPLLVLRLLLARHLPAVCVCIVCIFITCGCGYQSKTQGEKSQRRRGLHKGHSQLRVGLAGVAVLCLMRYKCAAVIYTFSD